MNGLSFIIPIKIDNEDRVFNIKTVIKYLSSLSIGADDEIIVVEQINKSDNYQSKIIQLFENKDTLKNLKIILFPVFTNFFYKTKLINIGITNSKNDTISVYDADILIQKDQLLKAFNNVLETKNPTHPFNGYLINIPKSNNANFLNFRETFLNKFLNNDMLEDLNYSDLAKNGYISKTPPGGCVLFDKRSIIDIGLYNENFISYGPEDAEIVDRYRWLGKTVNNVFGHIYHLDHSRTSNSCCPVLAKLNKTTTHFNYENNINLYNKLKNMDQKSLKEYYQIS